MYYLSAVSVLLFSHSVLALLNCSNDCIPIEDCEAASVLVLTKKTNDTIQKLRSSFCGFTETRDFKVCCSLFSSSTELRFNEWNSHANIQLLPSQCGALNGNRIIGGSAAALYEFPWMALISYRLRTGVRFLCGGSLINERYVVTAAHCVENKNIAGVRLGEYNTESKIDCVNEICESFVQDVLIERAIVHPEYKKTPTIDNDIALLRLKQTAEATHKNIGFICLPLPIEVRNISLDGEYGLVTGWGTTEAGHSSNIILKAKVPIKSPENCSTLYNRENKEWINKICAGELGRDSCSGDSGGPLIIEKNYNEVSRLYLYGIVSYGPKQCGQLYPGVYTDVRQYIDWILDNIEA